MTHNEELETKVIHDLSDLIDLTPDAVDYIREALTTYANSRIQEFVDEVRDALYAKRTRANMADDESDDWYLDLQDVADVFDALSQKYISKDKEP